MSGNPRRREVRALTLGFLSLGANAAPLDVLSAAAEAGFGAVGLRVSGRNPGDPWPQPNAEGDGLERIRARAEALSIRISSISGYYMSEKTSLSHLLANVEAARRVGAPLISQGCFEPDPSRVAELLRDYARAADDAGVPKHVKNMDTRSGAITEAAEAGADMIQPISVELICNSFIIVGVAADITVRSK